MANIIKPLNPSELYTVAQELNVLRQYIEKIIPFLNQEIKRSPQNIVAYEQEYEQLVKSLQKLQELLKGELGWFSHFNRLLSHAQTRLRECKEMKLRKRA